VGSWLFYFSRGRLDVADEATDELFQVAETLGDPELRLQAHHAAWPVPMLRGAFAVADEHIEKGLALYDYEKHKHHAFVYMGHDPAVCGHGLGAQIVWALGFTDRARRHAEDALKLARRLGHAPTLSIALWFVGNFQVASGDIAGALSTAEDLFELSEKQALVQTRAAALAMRGWALAQSGHPQDGIEQIQAALDVWHRIGTRPYLQVFSCLLAECWMRTQQYVEALECATQALAYGKQSGERWWEARIHDLRGQLLLHSSSRNREGAAEAFETAIQIAHDQQAKALELRAATSLGRLWAEQGERQKAYDMLAPIYGWFTEGLDTPNLKDADKLLHELA
jgi:predicted ATPase